MQLDFKFLDLPTFRTGEAGPLLGRVVIDLPAGFAPVEAKAEIILENASSGPGETRLLYPGVSSSLDFPVKLDKAYTENNSLSGQLKVTVGDKLVLTRPVFVLVREYGMYFRTYRSSLDGAVYPYALYLPKDVDKPGAKWPLVVSLHGAWSNHANNLRRLFGIGNRPGEPDEQVFFSMPLWPQLPDAPGIVVCPWGHGTMTYHGPGALDVQEVFDIVRKEYPVDPERTSLTGLSMGGNGTWEFALRRAGVWASAYPVCAVADFAFWPAVARLMPEDPKSVSGLELSLQRNQIANWALNARGIRFHLFHGNDDPTVPIAHSEKMLKALAAVGVEAPLTRFDNVGHNAWDPAYRDGKVLRELMESRRERPFRSIDFTTCRYSDSRYGWLTIAEFQTYGPFATVKAVWDPAVRTVTLNEVSNATRLQLDTKELLKGAPGEISVTLRGKTLRLSPDAEGMVNVNLSGGKLAASGKTPAAPFKRKGLEGPLYDAFCDRVILVYGTREGGNLSEAVKMSYWGPLADLHFIIKPDTAVTEQDIRDSHLVLFGDEKTNLLIGRINANYPIRFEGERIVAGKESFPRAGTAFKCVFPNPLNPSRLALVNYSDEWKYGGEFGFVGFKCLPDYIIYSRGSDRPWGAPVLKAGFFDKQWRW